MANINSVTDGFFVTAQEGFVTTTSGSVSSGATTVGLNDVSGYNNGEWVTLVIEPDVPSKKQVFHGKVDVAGSQITDVEWTEGTNTAHSAGVAVVDYETATAWALQAKGFGVAHNQDGTLKEAAIVAGLGAGSLPGAKIEDATVTPNKLNLGAQAAYVADQETTTSGSYTDLTTTTDTVTTTIGANGVAIVSIFANMLNNTTTGQALMSFEMSGANTQAASDAFALRQVFTGNYEIQASATFVLTGLNAGSTTFKLKYKRLTAGTANFKFRRIAVVPL